MAEPNLIYKIAILKLLHKSDFPLSNSQLADFFFDYNLTDYFTIQRAINDDVEAGLITPSRHHNSTTYIITEEGLKTLELLGDKITPALSRDIDRYFAANSISMREENSYLATYFKADRGGYIVQLKISENSVSTMELSFHVGNKEQAVTLCNNWRAKSDRVYASIMDILMG